MSRPLTRGATIPVQLPLTVDAEIRRRAELAGLSPGRYLANQISHSVTRTIGAPPPPKSVPQEGRSPTPQIQAESNVCSHPDGQVTRSLTGMWICRCAATSHDRGVTWRGPQFEAR